MKRRAPAGFVLASIAFAGPACSQVVIDEAAQTAIERSRTTDATYSIYTWNRIVIPGSEPIEEWAAEFHKGTLHRVETPRDRVVADCAAKTGTHFSLVSGERVSNRAVADAACGVQANSQILSASFDGRTTGPFGVVEHITIRDPEHVRTYQIAANGAIVGTTIEDLDGTVLLESRVVALRDNVSGDVFSQKSLARSEVPEKFKNPPAQ